MIKLGFESEVLPPQVLQLLGVTTAERFSTNPLPGEV